ncbi:MAG: ATP-dependent Clp protease ATP-binding subunit [Caldisericia bacterium]|nr:ATP-dependent Clp protease ATP-binding subunit [Caldisericia bacterium]MDD4614197.1 ATP-dependent Clp protease ATP-binding subunit [Caldisericia bacterium]
MNWDILSRRAKRAISIARKEARSANNRFLYPEHLCIGLIRSDEDISNEFIAFSVEIKNVLDILLHMVHEKDQRKSVTSSLPTDSEIDLSLEVKDILEKAARRSQEEFRGQIDTEILFECLLEAETSVSTILRECSMQPLQLMRNIHFRKSFTSSQSSTKDTPTDSIFLSFPTSLSEPSEDSSRPPHSMQEYSLVDITRQAEKGELEMVIGREKEMDRILQILARKKKNNPLIIGDPGVGKTVIVESLAQRIVHQKVPGAFRNQRILKLDVCSFLSGTKYRGDIEQKIQTLFAYLEKQGNVILFIDEIHFLTRHAKSDNGASLIGQIQSYFQNQKIRIIGTCDTQSYQKRIESEHTFLRQFQPVFIEEPSPEETFRILQGVRPSFEKHHFIHISDEAIESAVALSSKYISGRYQPDQAIDLLDEACAYFCFVNQIPPDALMEAKNQFEKLQTEARFVKVDNQALSKEFQQKYLTAQEEFEKERKEWKKEASKYTVSKNDVAHVVSQWTGIPMGQLVESEKEKLLHIEEDLETKIVGQSLAVHTLANALRRSRMGIKDSHKPMGVFLFLGPTGVGKTETARVLAEYLFGSRKHMIRFDMSEYMEKHTVSRLIGAPPGYVGYEEGGQLTESVKKKPYSILLFDEIEKAHPDIFNVWLQLFDEGRLTDAKGTTVDASNCIVVLTSNIVHHSGEGLLRLGFSAEDKTTKEHDIHLGDQLSSSLFEKLKHYFRPELLNRLDEVIVFNTLTQNQLLRIVDILLQRMEKDLEEVHLHIKITEEAKKHIVEEGYSKDFGARPLKRVLQKRVADVVSLYFIQNHLNEGEVLCVEYANDEYSYTVLKDSKSSSLNPK